MEEQKNQQIKQNTKTDNSETTNAEEFVEIETTYCTELEALEETDDE
jgi:hypothetical protein